MAKITSMIEFVGSAGNMTGYKGRDGRNVIRKRTWNRRNAKSPLQMRRRVQWPNLVQSWKAILPYMHPSFENKSAGQTDFNAFMQANVDSNCVFLTKKESRLGVCIAAPYVITRGTLPEVVMSSVAGGRLKTDIALGDITIDADTNVSAFARAVVNNNNRFAFGDQISFLLMTQAVVGESRIPKVIVTFEKVVLDSNDNRKLLTVIGSDNGFSVSDGYLCTKSSLNGACAYIHSRLQDGKTIVSPAQLSVNNNLLEAFTSQEAQLASIKSYKGAAAKELTPLGDEYLAERI